MFGEGAILLRPGVASRLGEAERMRQPLKRHFNRILELEGDEYADGGDVLVTPNEVLIGLSKRTTPTGAHALASSPNSAAPRASSRRRTACCTSRPPRRC